jgi:hypothetical protein
VSPTTPLAVTPLVFDSLDSLTQVIAITQFAPSCNSIANAIGEFVLTPNEGFAFCLSALQRPTCFFTACCVSSRPHGIPVAPFVAHQTEPLRTHRINRRSGG